MVIEILPFLNLAQHTTNKQRIIITVSFNKSLVAIEWSRIPHPVTSLSFLQRADCIFASFCWFRKQIETATNRLEHQSCHSLINAIDKSSHAAPSCFHKGSVYGPNSTTSDAWDRRLTSITESFHKVFRFFYEQFALPLPCIVLILPNKQQQLRDTAIKYRKRCDQSQSNILCQA